MPIVKIRKGRFFGVQVCAVAWFDLLGFGSMLEKASFDPTSELAREAVLRLRRFHLGIERHRHARLPAVVLNDGGVLYRDLSFRSPSATADFLLRSIDAFHDINGVERKHHHPGARMVIAAGFRVRGETPDGQKERVAATVDELMSKGRPPREVVTMALQMRSPIGVARELNANFAFTKAYLVDHGGTREGFGGPNCFVDLALLDDPIPEYAKMSKVIDWKGKGMTARFGQLERFDRIAAGRAKQAGVLAAADIARKLATGDVVKRILASKQV